MKPIYYLLSSLLFAVSCSNPANEEDAPVKKINIGCNRTIETIMILRAIHPDEPILRYRSDTSKGRPMVI